MLMVQVFGCTRAGRSDERRVGKECRARAGRERERKEGELGEAVVGV